MRKLVRSLGLEPDFPATRHVLHTRGEKNPHNPRSSTPQGTLDSNSQCAAYRHNLNAVLHGDAIRNSSPRIPRIVHTSSGLTVVETHSRQEALEPEINGPDWFAIRNLLRYGSRPGGVPTVRRSGRVVFEVVCHLRK